MKRRARLVLRNRSRAQRLRWLGTRRVRYVGVTTSQDADR